MYTQYQAINPAPSFFVSFHPENSSPIINAEITTKIKRICRGCVVGIAGVENTGRC